jgi:hypothetical protein
MHLRLLAALPFLVVPTTVIASTQSNLCEGSGSCPDNPSHDPSKTPEAALQNTFTDIANIAMYIAGALAVLVIIFGGIRYITSTGDATRIKQAKDTIQYGIVGLVVVIMAYAIVNFVIKQLT